jgi:hypothetical protein
MNSAEVPGMVLQIPTFFSFFLFSSSLSNLKANISSRRQQRNCAFGKRIVSGLQLWLQGTKMLT